jgi:two-component system sensor histidine kinase CpxA
MKLRLPLYARFLVWLALNLVLLAAVFWLLVRTEFRLDSLVAGVAGERVQQVADVIFGELRTRPAAEWDATLTRFSEAYGVKFTLLGDRGDRLAGTELELPEEVRQRIRSFRGGPGGPGGPGGAGVRREGPPPGDPPEQVRRPDGRPGGRPEFGAPRSFIRTTEPPAYWVIVRAPLNPSEQGRPQLARLVVMSPTLSAGGLLFDFTPWWIGGGAVLLLSVLWWLPFVGSITRSLGQMTAATERIAEGEFAVSVNERRSDELGRLGGAINRMALRLAGFVTGQKRFLGDIAHELCTPLARMEMALGILDQRADAKQRDYVNDVREEVRHMSGLVNELLSFSKASLRAKDAPLTTVPLQELAERVVVREAGSADNVMIEVPSDLSAQAEPELLARAVGNLVRNALRYAGHAGPVRLSAVAQGGEVVVTVSDEGPGVPAESLARLAEPFYRPDAARTREQGGVGLGLAIVKSCVDACRGKLVLRNRQPKGFEAEIRLTKA